MELLRAIWLLVLLVCTAGFGLCGGWGMLLGVERLFQRGVDSLVYLLLFPGLAGVGIAVIAAYAFVRIVRSSREREKDAEGES